MLPLRIRARQAKRTSGAKVHSSAHLRARNEEREKKMSDNETRIRPQVKLTSVDHQQIINACRRAAVSAGWSPCDWRAFLLEATMASCGRFMQHVHDHFDVI